VTVFHFLRRNGQNDDQNIGVESPGQQTIPQRPTIALVLGGGAARGFAHIGVVRTLIARGLTPDIITGTSIGAVIGGVYAAGKLDEFEAWGRGLTRRGVLGYLDLSFGGSGLINGSRLAGQLAESLGDIHIEQLSQRYAAIATEIGTGHEIWLTRGRLVDAMRASYALPGIFAPVPIAGRWLMDGALVNPLPVSVARALGARVVIAVNLNADNFGRGTVIPNGGGEAEPAIEEFITQRGLVAGVAQAAEKVSPAKDAKRHFFGTPTRPGISTVMVEAFNIMQDRITRARLAGDPPDVLISPRLGRVGLFEFHRAKEIIELGADAAEKGLEPVTEAIATLT
jgi:NTE family protein